MDNIFESLKDIEKHLEGEEYFEGGISYCFVVDKLIVQGDKEATLKKYFLDIQAISVDEEIVLQKIPGVESDIKSYCNEWHISDEFSETFVRATRESQGYYKVCDDNYYISKGALCDIFRILEVDNSLVILEFYLVD